jgi:hypothetical protein
VNNKPENVNLFGDSDDQSIFENAKPFWNMVYGGRDLLESHMPSRDTAVKAIVYASSPALLKEDARTDAVYG